MTIISVPTPDAVGRLGDLPPDVEVVVWDGSGERPAQADGIEFFVARYDAPPVAADVLAGLPRLEVVQLVSAGVEPWLDRIPENVQLCNGRGVHGASTAELALAGLLAVLRELPRFEDARRAHRWDRELTDGLAGRRVLVLGAGDIGSRIAAAARIFDAQTTLVARSARDGVHGFADLPALLPESDVVAIAIPHTPQTHRLVDAAFLAAMPDSAVLVNIARGAIVDTDALLAELQAGRLRAFLDVTDPEPLPAGHPLWAAPNLVLTPHIGGGTHGWEDRAYRLVREQVLRYLAGQPLENLVENGY
ncbi:MAG: 2-hydroxyacid dehydrogenase [Jatrophihabitans sp.]|uniref:2-hydroxyacid dehydrogenase n=1 Tax=Jatrophihabitans sp. TaxID=1932789 RepID=UPI0039164233